MRAFDRRFGADFLNGVPEAPGVYRFCDATGLVVYVLMWIFVPKE